MFMSSNKHDSRRTKKKFWVLQKFAMSKYVHKAKKKVGNQREQQNKKLF